MVNQTTEDQPKQPEIPVEEEVLYVLERYLVRYEEHTFNRAMAEYILLDDFKINQNVEEVNGISEEAHYIMRLMTQYHITKAFKAMKVTLDDPNVEENLEEGNIGTPGRLAKVWCGSNLSDSSELGSGRWTKEPRIAVFPNTNTSKDIPITKRIDLVSNCSHHLISFNTLNRPDSYAIISYIPDEFVLGISKLQRLTDWISRRFWLQEDVTSAIYDKIADAAQTDSVYVKIVNAVHGCEQLRGAQSNDGAFSSEMFGGMFTDPEMRKQVDRSI